MGREVPGVPFNGHRCTGACQCVPSRACQWVERCLLMHTKRCLWIRREGPDVPFNGHRSTGVCQCVPGGACQWVERYLLMRTKRYLLMGRRGLMCLSMDTGLQVPVIVCQEVLFINMCLDMPVNWCLWRVVSVIYQLIIFLVKKLGKSFGTQKHYSVPETYCRPAGVV